MRRVVVNLIYFVIYKFYVKCNFYYVGYLLIYFLFETQNKNFVAIVFLILLLLMKYY